MIHTIIAQERRKAPRPLATLVGGQLHSMGDSYSNVNDPQLLYIADWDMVSPWITVLKGSIASLKMAYLGWPMIDKVTYDAQHPPV